MRYIVLDTSHTFLRIGLVEEDQVVRSYQEPCHKSQSELILPVLVQLMEEAQWSVDQIDGVVVTAGPGSYTGVRIAMTVAKVLCAVKPIALYTLSTLQAYAGLASNALVVVDARSNRVYAGWYDQGTPKQKDTILSIAEAKELQQKEQLNCIGDAQLLNQETQKIDVIANIVALHQAWQKEENIHTVIPTYLKDQDAYGK